MNKPTSPAGAEKDFRPEERNDRTEPTNGADTNYPNRLNNKNEMGSPYGGTQSPDSRVPDGNQTPPRPDAEGKDIQFPELGEEYGSESSYGEAESGGKKGENAADDAGGSSVR